MKIKFVKLISVLATLAMLLTVFAVLSVSASAAMLGSTLTHPTAANNWGRSDLRAYLNGVSKSDNTLPYNTVHSAKQALGYYESYFSDAEYALIAPYTYNLVVNDINYGLTDKFWLPSGNYSNDSILSFGASDISVAEADTARIIPLSYWTSSWLRSSFSNRDTYALSSLRGYYTNINAVNTDQAVAPAFKLDISNVTFAAMASAAPIVAEGGNCVYYILGSTSFGKKTNSALPDYGMYLKTASDSNLEVNNVSYSDKRLNVTYSDASVGEYIVVQAYKNDDLMAGCEAYTAAQKISSASGTATVSVDGWNLSSLDGYTVKIWAEKADSGSSLAKATAPKTFVGANGSVAQTNAGSATNSRVFAMNNELQCSWGKLASADALVGENPTNQKLYFGTDSNGMPMQFWIAGRESYISGTSPIDGDGVIDANGSIITLYSAKTVENRRFNSSTSDYTSDIVHELGSDGECNCGVKCVHRISFVQTDLIISGECSNCDAVVIFELKAPKNLIYDGTLKKATVVCESDILPIPEIVYKSGVEILDTPPVDVGEYTASITVDGCTASVDFTIYKIVPTADMFMMTPPLSLVYDETVKHVAVDSNVSGIGAITVKYYDENNTLVDGPVNAGRYTVKIDVAESELCAAVSDLIIGEFTVERKLVTVTVDDVTACVGSTVKYSYAADGFLGSDYFLTEPYLDSDYDGKTAGEYAITASGATENGNYEIKYVDGKLTVKEHKYGDWKPLDDYKHQHTCECGDTVSAEHAWGDGEITKSSACLQSGEKTFTCADCGAKLIELLDPLVHSYDNLCDIDCNACGATRAPEHSDADGNGVCDVCSYEYPKSEPSETDGDGVTDKTDKSEESTDEKSDENKGGCGSAIALSALLTVVAFAAVTVFKRKEQGE